MDEIDFFIEAVHRIFEKKGIECKVKYLLMVCKVIDEIEKLDKEEKENDHELRSR